MPNYITKDTGLNKVMYISIDTIFMALRNKYIECEIFEKILNYYNIYNNQYNMNQNIINIIMN